MEEFTRLGEILDEWELVDLSLCLALALFDGFLEFGVFTCNDVIDDGLADGLEIFLVRDPGFVCQVTVVDLSNDFGGLSA